LQESHLLYQNDGTAPAGLLKEGGAGAGRARLGAAGETARPARTPAAAAGVGGEAAPPIARDVRPGTALPRCPRPRGWEEEAQEAVRTAIKGLGRASRLGSPPSPPSRLELRRAPTRPSPALATQAAAEDGGFGPGF
jgi:hypothetical protein